MIVKVEGIVTSIRVSTKDDKPFTEIFLAQDGEREQVNVRLNGNKQDAYSRFEIASFEGRLLQWRTRDGVGNMVMVQENG